MTSRFALSSLCAATVLVSLLPVHAAEPSVARIWNEQNLGAIRLSFPDPPVHSRNLFHVSVAMYDAWAAYDPLAVGYLTHEKAEAPGTVAEARHEAVTYAAYRLLSYRYVTHRHPITPQESAEASELAFEAQMADFGYDPDVTTTEGSSPAAVGNRVAAAVLAYAATDDSKEDEGYEDETYEPVNAPLVLVDPGTVMVDPNRWQPLAFEKRVSQGGGIVLDSIQTFLGSHWGGVRPFALHYEEGASLYHDPGAPPYLNGVGDAEFKDNNLDVIRFSSVLDPDAGTMIDCSPATFGNNTLGFNNGTGYDSNPVTGEPYEKNMINLADFGRVLAEFWADGPHSETPPGHWNTLANKMVDHPDFVARIGGTGPILDPLEWDVKMYLPLNGAVHDVSVAVWGCKRVYDYVRPISSIRYLGQRNELPLEPGLVEIITEESSAFGERHEHLGAYVGQTAIYAWGGEPDDAETQYTGSEWILPEDWLPYQRATFVTPAFAGYVSGHSAFSRAAAEVLTHMTGSPYFPGGMGTHTVEAGSLEFEKGPSTEVTLQWATYYDAADQAGISRLYGGIHVAPDDGPGRIIGSQCGLDSWALAQQYYDGSIATEPVPVRLDMQENGDVLVSWYQTRGLTYSLRETGDLRIYRELIPSYQAEGDLGSMLVPQAWPTPSKNFYEVMRATMGP